MNGNFIQKLIFLGIFFLVFLAKGQHTTPFFQNYSKADYKGDNKNWGITQGPSGSLYVANNRNLLEYNGDFWTRAQLPSKAVLRSVRVIDDTLYTGAYHEFGYWVHDDANKLIYRSLSRTIEKEFKSDEFWKIIPYQDKIVFQSFNALYLMDRGTKIFQKVEFPAVSGVFAFALANQLYLTTKGSGIYRLKEKQLIFEPWSEALKGFTIQAMLPYRQGALIATQLNGIYYFENGKVSLWLAPNSKKIKGLEINNLSFVDGQICVGTINNGLLVIDPQKNIKYSFNKKSGMLNNTVLHQFVDRSNTLWLGLDNGLASLHLTTPIYNFTDKSGKLGTVYSMSETGNDHELLLGSNQGIFKKKADSLQFVPGSNGMVWDLSYLKKMDEVIVGHNSGTFSFNHGKYHKIYKSSGGRAFLNIPNIEGYVQPYYGGLSLFNPKKNGNWEITPIKGIHIPVNQVEFDRNGNIWVNTLHEGIYRYQMVSGDSLKMLHHYPKKRFNGLFKVNEEVFLTRPNTVYKFDAVNDTLVPEKILQEKLVPFHQAMAIHDKYIVSRLKNNISILNIRDGKRFAIDSKITNNRLVQDFNFSKGIGEDIYLFLVDGFLKISMDSLKMTGDIPKPELASVIMNNKPRSLAGNPAVSYDKNEVGFRLTYHQPSKLSRTAFWYQLKGYDEKQRWHRSKSGVINYENLPMGDYVLLVKSKLRDNKIPVIKYSFTILAPWYFNTWAWVAYTLLAFIIFYLIHYSNKRKYKLKRRRFEQESAYESKLELQRQKMKNEQRIAAMEKEQLKEQLKSKTKELATYAGAIAKKEEILSEIEKEINKSNIKKENEKLYAKWIEIKERQSNSENDWKLFERNFSEVHEEFFKKLQQQYPKLTASDLKLCAYLKMNLSSKEIAPLIGITYRSVELHRYRLRKKLRLRKNQNLVKFLLRVA